ncbi:MAG TPA: EAL domain-containing protein [Candidatus Angelobacter sp.]|nr:EAL domain-containing protein [Candidatus Angelobacter sp.]
MTPGVPIHATYDYRLVALSVVIAIFASYAALELAARVTATRGTARLAWLVGGACAMGTGIWSMHYTGMLAYQLPIPVFYHIPTVLLSLLAAIFASCIALLVVSREELTTVRVIIGSLLMGAGITTMHYTGMAAMRLSAMHHYHHDLLTLSGALAVMVSLAALWLTYHFREGKSERLLKIASSIIMGLAIPVMHYTGMAAVHFVYTGKPPDLTHALGISTLANTAVILATLVILGTVLLTSLVDRRFSAQAQELAMSEQRYQLLFESSPQPAFVFDLNTLAFLAVNRSAVKTYGLEKDEFLTLTMPALAASQDSNRWMETADTGSPFKTQHRRKDGSVFDVELFLRRINWAGSPAALMLAADVTERRRTEQLELERRNFLETITQNQPLEDSLRQLVQLLEHQLPGSLCLILLAKPGRLCQIAASSFSKEQVAAFEALRLEEIGQAFGMESSARDILFIDGLLSSKYTGNVRDWAQLLDVNSCWLVPVVDPSDALVSLIFVFFPAQDQPGAQDRARLEMARDMASIAVKHRQLTDRLSYQAQHDALTGLPNRFLLEDRLQQAIAYANRHESQLAVLIIDLDGFKYINDTVGHQSGDQLLVEVARRLRSVTRRTDTLARIGGDEFCLVLSDLYKSSDSFQVAQTCLDILRKPFLIAEREYSISASIGVSCYPEHGAEPELLQQNADTAMYHAKFNGKNGVQVFTPEINAHLRERLELMADLRHALENGELHLVYQPQFVSDGVLAGFEALLRWHHSKRGIIPPDKFIPIAEETGFIVPLGNWVLDQACHQLASWRRSGHSKLRIAVNVSTLQFERQDWMQTISSTLKRHGVPASCLELELTETVVMKNCERAAVRLAELRKLGVSSAIDDFGTGYSSLKYLQNLPIDTLKIDQSFIRNLDRSAEGLSGNGAIVQAIVTLAQQLGLRVVAEGVETQEELDVLRQLGCDFVQGYLFARPMSVEDCEKFLSSSSSGKQTLPLLSEAAKGAVQG